MLRHRGYLRFNVIGVGVGSYFKLVMGRTPVLGSHMDMDFE